MNPRQHLRPVKDPSGRLPPHDIERERYLLDAVVNNARLRDELLAVIKPEHFYVPSHTRIFDAVLDLVARDKPVDLVSVGEVLRDRGQWEACKLDLVAMTETPSLGRHMDHARALVALWRLRTMIALCQRAAAEGYDQHATAAEHVERVAAELTGLADEGASEDSTTTLQEALWDVFTDLQKGKQLTDGIRTGLIDLDAVMGPMCGGQLIIIGAHSGIGKTSIAMNCATNLAGSDESAAVCVFSAEMPAREIAQRALYGAARVDNLKAFNADLVTNRDWQNLAGQAEAMGKFGQRVWIDDRADLSVLQIRSKARRIKLQAARRNAELKLVVVDYAQLITARDLVSKSANREEEVSAVGRHLKNMAKELNVPVILLAQLNDDANKSNRKPQARDLRESKALHMHADKVVLIHNPHARARAEAKRNGESMKEEARSGEVVDLIVDKARGGGRTGTVEVAFFPQYTLFTNYHKGMAGVKVEPG